MIKNLKSQNKIKFYLNTKYKNKTKITNTLNYLSYREPPASGFKIP